LRGGRREGGGPGRGRGGRGGGESVVPVGQAMRICGELKITKKKTLLKTDSGPMQAERVTKAKKGKTEVQKNGLMTSPCVFDIKRGKQKI